MTQLPPPQPPALDPLPYAQPHGKPKVVTWFNVYAVGMAVLYAATMALGVFFLAKADEIADADMTAAEARVFGTMMLVMGFVIAAGFAAALFLPRRPWVWIYDIVLIAFGMTSCCLWPAAIPLLIYWIKPEVKAWYGRVG